MSLRTWVLPLIALSLPLSNAAGSDPPTAPSDAPAKLVRAKLEAARRTFEKFWKDKQWREVEIPYRWSRRLLKAQCQASDKTEDRVAAFQQHLDRMQELERITRGDYRKRFDTISEVSATEYYVVEAAEWLERVKAEGGRSVAKQ
jgi:hypothetical protein